MSLVGTSRDYFAIRRLIAVDLKIIQFIPDMRCHHALRRHEITEFLDELVLLLLANFYDLRLRYSVEKKVSVRSGCSHLLHVRGE